MYKRTISIVLACCMIWSSLPISVLATNISTISTEDNRITIDGEIEEEQMLVNDELAENNQAAIKEGMSTNNQIPNNVEIEECNQTKINNEKIEVDQSIPDENETLIEDAGYSSSDLLTETVLAVQLLINELPTPDFLRQMDEKEQEAVYIQVQNVYDAYQKLAEEEQSNISGAEIINELFDYFNSFEVTLGEDIDDVETYSGENKFANGTGTESDPYIISNREELLFFAQSVNEGIDYTGKVIALSNDIYLNSIEDYYLWSDDYAPEYVWEGITGFTGEFDGKGFTIFGLYIHRLEDNTGFFNELNKKIKVTVKNLTFRNIYISGTSNVGSIVGKADYIQIENCNVSGVIKGTGDNVGGFVGFSGSAGHRGTRIYNCTNEASITGNNCVGGITGRSYIGNAVGIGGDNVGGSEKIIINGCINKGNILGKGNYVGGIAGYLERSMNCKGMELDKLSNFGKISGGDNVGGISGYVFSWVGSDKVKTDVDYCFNGGAISGGNNIGGIIGACRWGGGVGYSTSVNNSYNVETITGTGSAVGGIIGTVNQGNNVNYSFNIGKVTATSNASGLIGVATCTGTDYANINNSYYLAGTAVGSKNGNIRESEVKVLTYEKMKVESNFRGYDFDSVWKMGKEYPVFQWQNSNPYDDSVVFPNEAIVQCVMEYTSDEIYAQFKAIDDSNYSQETKYKKYLALFSSYGITDVKEGIDYLSNTTDKRLAYLGLTENDLYCASNYLYWLNNTEKGMAARAVLFVDGLIFNNEINDWLDFSTYLESDYPGVSKYKDMLYDFMGATEEDIAIQSYIKLVSDLSETATDIGQLKADELIDKLNECETVGEVTELINSNEGLDVWMELAKQTDKSGNYVTNENGDIKFTYRLDKSSGFGQFAKAMDIGTQTVSIVDVTLSNVKDLLKLDSKLAVYAQYREFLMDIKSDTEGIPYELRWAADLILKELDSEYIGKMKDIAFDILEEAKFDEKIRDKILDKIGLKSFSSWLTVIEIEAFFINIVADIGETVQREAYVEGYAYLADAFAKKLEVSKNNFILNKTEINAWDFYYNYNILYRLRYKGEEAYLKMSELEGILSFFSDFGYSVKKEAVNDTLVMLDEKFKFVLDESIEIPESCQFATKSVIACPVDVEIYTPDGTLITVLVDGVESDEINNYGRFAVVYDTYSGDYIKVICFNTGDDYKIRIIGVDNGLVNMELATVKDTKSMYVFDNVPINKGNVFETTISQVTEENSYTEDLNGDGKIDSTGELDVENKTHINVESLDLDIDKVKIHIGENLLINVKISPTNATDQSVSWIAANSDVATVINGKISAIAPGMTTIYCVTADNTDFVEMCEVYVENHDYQYGVCSVCGSFDIAQMNDLLKNLTIENVTSADKNALDKLATNVNDLIDAGNITDVEKSELETLDEKIESLISRINEAAQAISTEYIKKVKYVTSDNVTAKDKINLEHAKIDLKKAQQKYQGNYTLDEKQLIQSEVDRIKKLIASIENWSENVEIDEELTGNTVQVEATATSMGKNDTAGYVGFPNTGDNSNVFTWLFIVIVCSVSFTTNFYYRKMKKNKSL